MSRQVGEFGALVHERVSSLQYRYVHRRTPSASAQLAQLRTGVGRPPGSIPVIWDLTLEGLPRPGTGDEPSAQELAAHTALTLYAVHQQAGTREMHQPGQSLGSAVRQLVRARAGGGADPERERSVRRRFDALLTASSFAEVAYHLRGLITQLRAADIGLDYGRLAEDLERLRTPAGFDRVRRAWGRDYHRFAPADPGAGDATEGASDADSTDATEQNPEDQ